MTRTVARLTGAVLLLANAAIHLDLYLTGYREIPTIGWMFLVQVIATFAAAAAVIATTRVSDKPLGRITAAGGAGLALGTLAGYLVSLNFGLFGFQETRTTAGIVAATIELAAFVALGLAALPVGRRSLALGPIGLVIAAIIIAAEAVGGAGVAAVTGPAPSHSGQPSITIVIKNFMFHPMDPKVTPGEQITVHNEDSVAHTFTGANSKWFNTGPINPGTSKVLTAPTTPGSYRFLCSIHQFMTGTLEVARTS